jgi:uncharacterized membrane protein
VRWASVAVGGPPGDHARTHPRLTALVVALAVCAATFATGLALRSPCASGAWWDPPQQYANHCWSRLPYDYTTRGLAERTPPLSDDGGRFPPPRDTPPVALVAYGAAIVSSAVSGWPDVGERGSRPVTEIAGRVDVRAEAVTYTGIVSLVLLVAALSTVGLLTRLHRPRPWDAMAAAAAPVLLLTATNGWDLLAVALATGALWAWSRARVPTAGVLAGVGAATAGWPVVVALAAGLLCLRERQAALAGRLLAATAGGFAAVVLPAYLLAPEGVAGWWSAALRADVGDGATWQVPVLVNAGVPPVGWLEPLAVTGVLVAVAALALRAQRRPRVPQVALLILVGLLLVHRTHEPASALWLLPLAALARPRWRDLILWQLGEVAYVLALGWHLQGYTTPDSGRPDVVFTVAVLVRIVAELWLAAVVVRDVLRPWHDPVRATGRLDDPAGGPLDEAAALSRSSPRRTRSW